MEIKLTAVLMCALALCGCASGNASYVESGGARSVVTTNKINMADWNSAASALVNEMLSSDVFSKLNPPVKMQVSRIINRTSNSIDTDMLTKQICIALNNSGKAVALSSDASAKELAKYQALKNGTSTAVADIVLSGKIMEDRDSNNDVNEVTYVFVVDINHNGAIVWSGQKQISKQSSKGIFGL